MAARASRPLSVPKDPKDFERWLLAQLSRLHDSVAALSGGRGELTVRLERYEASAGEFVRVSPPPEGMAVVLPPPGPENLGLTVTIFIELPQGTLSVVSAPVVEGNIVTPATVNGGDVVTYDAEGVVTFHSNGVNRWQSTAELATVDGATTGAPSDGTFFLETAHPDLPNAQVAQDSNEIEWFYAGGFVQGRIRRVAQLVVGDPGTNLVPSSLPDKLRITLAGVNLDSALAVSGFGGTDIGFFTLRRHSDSQGPNFISARARGTTSTPSVVQAGDVLGNWLALGYDGIDYAQAGGIQIEVDGTPGSNDMPSRIRFFTTPDGSQSPAERLRINNAGALGFGGANFGSSGQVPVSQGSTGVPIWGSVVVPDGDYGDITISGGVWNIDAGVVGTTELADDSVTGAKLDNGAARSVLGRSSSVAGDRADIAAGSGSDAVLRESGTVIGFGTVATGGIADDAITNPKLANVAAGTQKGRQIDAGTGDPVDLTGLEQGENIRFGTVATASISGTVNNLVPTGFDDTTTNIELTLTADATWTGLDISGLSAVTGKELVVWFRTGSFTLTITHDGGTSTLGNRFSCPRYATRTYSVGERFKIRRDSTGYWAINDDAKGAFTSTAQGVVPASGGGTTNFLRADGTWATPVATGDGLGPDGDKGDITVGGTGTTLTIDNDAVTNAKLANMSSRSVKMREIGTGGDPIDGTSQQFAESIMGGVASQTAALSQTNTTANLTLISYTVPADYPVAGTVYELEVLLHISRGATATASTLTIELLIGGTVVRTLGPLATLTAASNRAERIVGRVHYYTTGGVGTGQTALEGYGDLTGTANAIVRRLDPAPSTASPGTTTISTTVNRTLEIRARFGTAVASLTMYATYAKITRVR